MKAKREAAAAPVPAAPDPWFNVDAPTLYRLLGRVEAAVSADETRPTLTSLQLFVHRGGAIYAVATDGHRLHRATHGDVRALMDAHDAWSRGPDYLDRPDRTTHLPEGWGYFPLPGRASVKRVRQICRSWKHGGTLRLAVQRFVLAEGPNTARGFPHLRRPAELRTTLVQGYSGDPYSFVLPSESAPFAHRHLFPVAHHELVTGPAALRAAVETAYKPPHRHDPNAAHDTEADSVWFEAVGPGDTCRVQGVMLDPVWAHAATCVAVHRRYMLDALDALRKGRLLAGGVRVGLAGGLDPLLVLEGNPHAADVQPDDESFTAVIMPIRT